MDFLRTLEKSANSTAAIARGVQPEQFDSPTPSAEWNVEKLMKCWTCHWHTSFLCPWVARELPCLKCLPRDRTASRYCCRRVPLLSSSSTSMTFVMPTRRYLRCNQAC